MSASKDTIDLDYLAKLARLELSESEKNKLGPQLQGIIEYVGKLSAVDVDGVEPTAHGMPRFNVWQEDDPSEPMDRSLLLENAPSHRDGQVVVPKVIE